MISWVRNAGADSCRCRSQMHIRPARLRRAGRVNRAGWNGLRERRPCRDAQEDAHLQARFAFGARAFAPKGRASVAAGGAKRGRSPRQRNPWTSFPIIVCLLAPEGRRRRARRQQCAVPGSCSQFLLHIVITTKRREPWIDDDLAPRLHALLGGIVRSERSVAYEIGGIEDHVRLLIRWRPDKSPRQCTLDQVRQKRANLQKLLK